MAVVLVLLKKNAKLKLRRPFMFGFQMLLPVLLAVIASILYKHSFRPDASLSFHLQTVAMRPQVYSRAVLGNAKVCAVVEKVSFVQNSLTTRPLCDKKENANELYQKSDGLSSVLSFGESLDKFGVSVRGGSTVFRRDFSQYLVVQLVSDGVKILLAATGAGERIASVSRDDQVNFGFFETYRNETARFLGLGLGVLLILVFTATVTMVVSDVLEERQLRLREVMSIQGVKDWHVYLSWMLFFTISYLAQAITVGCILGFTVFTHSSTLLLILVYWLFSLASIALVLLVTSPFDSSQGASLTGGLVYLFLVSVHFVSSGQRVLVQLLVPHVSFLHIMEGVGVMEDLYSPGLTFTGFFDVKNEQFNFGHALVCLIGNLCILTAVYLYVDRVVPHEFGKARLWYFPIQPLLDRLSSARAPSPATASIRHGSGSGGESTRNPAAIAQEAFTQREEQEIAEEQVADFAHMTRVFDADGASLRAVDDVSLTLFPSQVLSLLGANSAGKTTLTNMFLGLIDKTSGRGTVLGMDLDKHQAAIRNLTGFCPQQDVLWPELTVLEHMELFGSFRGLTARAARQQGLEALNDSGFKAKAHTKVKNLSGGMKRKLCAMIAFMGNTKFVILDEPTSGLDPFSRRALWDLIRTIKTGRIICLTTHYMDEAELLGDKIAIMALGKLRAYGSPLHLKQAFDCGYDLVITRRPSGRTRGAGDSSASRLAGRAHDLLVLEAVQKAVAPLEVTLTGDAATEIHMRIPLQAKPKLADVFQTLDQERERLGVESFTVNAAKLDEVFMKVARATAPQINAETLALAETSDADKAEPVSLRGFGLFARQVGGATLRRVRATARNRGVFVYAVVVPVALSVLGLLMPEIASRFVEESSYGDAVPPKLPIKYTVASLEAGDAACVGKLVDVARKSGWQAEPWHMPTEDVDMEAAIERDLRKSWNKDQHRVRIERGAEAFLKKHRESVDFAFMCLANSSYYSQTNGWMLREVPHIVANDLSRKKPLEQTGVIAEAAKLVNQTWFKLKKPMPKFSVHLEKFIWNSLAPEEWVAPVSGLVVLLALTFFGPSLALFVGTENGRGVKYHQFMHGMHVWSYWLGHVFVDSVLYCLFFAFLYCLIQYFDCILKDVFVSLLLFGLANVTQTYLVTTLVHSPTKAMWTSLGLNFAGLILTGLWFMFASEVDWNEGFVGKMQTVAVCGSLFPSFLVGQTLVRTVMMDSIPVDALGSGNWVGHVVTLTLAAVYLSLAVLIDRFRSTGAVRRSEVAATKDAVSEAEEQTLMEEGMRSVRGSVTVDTVEKTFGNLVAVKKVSMEVHPGEVFGLLGANSAGKTTLIRMIVGEILPDSGSIQVGSIGYCPQYDPIFEELSIQEHLEYYAAVKGMPAERAVAEGERLVGMLGLGAFVGTRAGRLSGGNKRKLCVAIAALNAPEVLILDEPSAGMDPLSQRFMWAIIKGLSKASGGHSILLTTHSMEEAEALSDRLAIMMTGRIRCTGTLGQIKTQFGRGLELSVRVLAASAVRLHAVYPSLKSLKEVSVEEEEETTMVAKEACAKLLVNQEDVEAFENEFDANEEIMSKWVFTEWLAEREGVRDFREFVHNSLGVENATLAESLGLNMRFLLSQTVEASTLFKLLEDAKERSLLDDYSLTQYTLEQIFNTFARNSANASFVAPAGHPDDETE